MHTWMLQFTTLLFWTACAMLLCCAAGVAGFLVRELSRVEPDRRSLLQQEVVWTLTSVLLVVGLAVASDVLPSRPHPAPAVRAH